MAKSENPKCPECNNKTIKFGLRRNKQQIIQIYKCKKCNKKFTLQQLKHKTYPAKIILNAVSYYNLGYTLEKSSRLINQRFKVNTSPQLISLWLKEYKQLCTFSRLRPKATKLYKPQNMLFKKPLQHQQVYLFQFHKAKLKLLENTKDGNAKDGNAKELPKQKFQLLNLYLQKIPTNNFPHHIFKEYKEKNINNKNNKQKRASQLKFSYLKITKLKKQNYANKLAKLALQIATTNKQRHSAIQNFMLANDSVTIAVEVPVYLTNNDILYFKSKGFTFDFKNYKTPITGHIDILQIRNSLIHILDYKPVAEKINPIEQLTIYALALASKTKLALKDFKCAWFDENNYYEFFPLHGVYKKRKV